jgi:hypothetical protein
MRTIKECYQLSVLKRQQPRGAKERRYINFKDSGDSVV